VSITFAGGGHRTKDLAGTPEKPDSYPEYDMFGPLPAHGFFCRHVRGLRLSRMRVETAQPDARPGLVCQDVGGMELFGWAAAANKSPAVVFHEVRNALVHGCQAAFKTGVWLRVEGANNAAIKLVANELSEAVRTVELGKGVPPDAVAAKPQL